MSLNDIFKAHTGYCVCCFNELIQVALNNKGHWHESVACKEDAVFFNERGNSICGMAWGGEELQMFLPDLHIEGALTESDGWRDDFNFLYRGISWLATSSAAGARSTIFCRQIS